MRSPSVSPTISDQDAAFVSPGEVRRERVGVHFSQVNILRALSHTVAVYDPELHPKKKFAVVRPAHSYMQIDEYISVHTLDDSAALSANLVVYSPTSPRQTVTQGNVMDPGSESDMIQLKKAIASAEGFPERETSPRPSTTTDYYEIFEAVQQQHNEREGNVPPAGPSAPKVHCDHFDPSFFFPIRTYAHQTAADLMKKFFNDEVKSEATLSDAHNESAETSQAANSSQESLYFELENNSMEEHEGDDNADATDMAADLEKLDVQDPPKGK